MGINSEEIRAEFDKAVAHINKTPVDKTSSIIMFHNTEGTNLCTGVLAGHPLELAAAILSMMDQLVAKDPRVAKVFTVAILSRLLPSPDGQEQASEPDQDKANQLVADLLKRMKP